MADVSGDGEARSFESLRDELEDLVHHMWEIEDEIEDLVGGVGEKPGELAQATAEAQLAALRARHEQLKARHEQLEAAVLASERQRYEEQQNQYPQAIGISGGAISCVSTPTHAFTATQVEAEIGRLLAA